MPSITFIYPDRTMTVELKAIKHSEFASEETHCYEASLYIDGKMLGKVGNDGHGGPDRFDPKTPADREAYREANTWIETNVIGSDGECDRSPLMKNIDWVCADLVNEWLQTKELKRITKGKIALVEDGQIYTVKYRGNETIAIQQVRKRHPKCTILNGMPVAEALAAMDEV